jgi:transmembrane sensor
MVTLSEIDRLRITAEASAWLTRVQDAGRTPETEAAFRDWLQASEHHQAAFARVTDIWQMLPGGFAIAENSRPATAVNKTGRWAVPLGMGAAVAFAATVLIAVVINRPESLRPMIYQTAPGQQQVMTLPDGSQVSMNTDTEIRVMYSRGKRHIELARGEALFDVVHNPKQPFLVLAGDEQVRALGTSFVVRHDADKIAVTLLKGSVELANRTGKNPLFGDKFASQIILSPGQRVSVGRNLRLVMDQPSIDAATAWRRGKVVFANTPLLEAVNEVNRYGKIKITIRDARISNLRVSGIFNAEETAEFASSMAHIHKLRIKRSDEGIDLMR